MSMFTALLQEKLIKKIKQRGEILLEERMQNVDAIQYLNEEIESRDSKIEDLNHEIELLKTAAKANLAKKKPHFALYELVTLHWNDNNYPTKIIRRLYDPDLDEWLYKVNIRHFPRPVTIKNLSPR